jgi:type IV conjugative transfer system protein TraL
VSDYSNYKIYKYIDAPNKTIIWRNDQLIAFVAPVFFGLAANHVFVGLALGVSIIMTLKALVTRFGRSAVAVLKYWYMYQHKQSNITPPSHIREMVG